jgi:hypothetical protein
LIEGSLSIQRRHRSGIVSFDDLPKQDIHLRLDLGNRYNGLPSPKSVKPLVWRVKEIMQSIPTGHYERLHE